MRKIPTLISISECQKVKARRYFVSYSRMLQRNSTINTLLLIPVSLQIPTEKTIMRRVVEKNLVQNDIIKMAQNALEFTLHVPSSNAYDGRDTSMVSSSTPRVSMSTFEISWESFIGKVRLLSETSSP